VARKLRGIGLAVTAPRQLGRSSQAGAKYRRYYMGRRYGRCFHRRIGAHRLCPPLLEWDVRSIWFFTPKRFFDGDVHPSDFWRNRIYDRSHRSDPALLPMMAARFSGFFGVWNEYAPKGAVVPLAASAFLGLLVVSRSALEFIFLASFRGAGSLYCRHFMYRHSQKLHDLRAFGGALRYGAGYGLSRHTHGLCLAR
jgi:hypothetical protein